jgi:threonine dehydratase
MDLVPTAVSPEAIDATYERLRPHIRRTPVVTVDRADFGLAPGPLVLKLEFLQHSGSFKARGAFANLLMRHIPPTGVVAASGGNHGAAVAYAARALGVSARIYVPTVSSPAKIDRIRGYGAELVVTGDAYAEAYAASERWRRDSSALPVHAFDQDETMLGTGTLATELLAQAPEATVVLAAVGGGGLLAGIAARYAGAVTVVAAEPEGAPTLHDALRAGRPVDAPVGSVAVDSLAPRRIGERNFPVLAKHVDRVALVDDDAIRDAQHRLWETLRIVAEPGGCTALAALLTGAYRPGPGDVPVVVVSGANTSAVTF